MKSQKILYSTALVFFLSLSCHGQIKLGLEVLLETRDSIKIKITSTNTSTTDTLIFYTPTEESFCVTVINIDFIQIGTNKEHSYFPCDWIADLDHILLNNSNSVLIPPSDSFSFNMSLDKKGIRPHLKKGKYRMKASLNYGYGNFKLESDSKHSVFNGNATSNDLVVTSK
jgi:hypothetical protein